MRVCSPASRPEYSGDRFVPAIELVKHAPRRMEKGEGVLNEISSTPPKKTIAGYIEDRIRSPYVSTQTGASYVLNVRKVNEFVPKNLYLVVGDEELEIQA
jgi:hypothetical protein